MRSGPLVWVALLVATLIIIFGIASVFAVSRDVWQAAGRRRWRWAMLMVFFGPLAVLLFYGTVRQHLLFPERYLEVDGVAPADR
jgi:hypothetical protein